MAESFIGSFTSKAGHLIAQFLIITPSGYAFVDYVRCKSIIFDGDACDVTMLCKHYLDYDKNCYIREV